MMRFLLLSIFFFALFFITSCSKNVSKKHKEVYIAHLELDSTLLKVSEIATDINIPWDIAIGHQNKLWFTEQIGTVNLLDLTTGVKRKVLTLPDVFHKKSYGLLGFTPHPDFESNPYVYLHYTFKIQKGELQEEIKSKIVRYSFKDDKLSSPKIILDSIVGNTYHNGSRLLITPDLKLYFSLGDVGKSNLAQNTNFLGGKIMRLNLDGTIPEDNPIKNSPIWSWGHRNPQGLTIGIKGKLYASEHGPNNDDEINLIQKGANYGWPNVQGYVDLENEKIYAKDSIITEPLKAWTPTIATAGLSYYNNNSIPEWSNSLLSVNLKGRSLRVLKLNVEGDTITSEKIYFQKRFGRIRDIAVGENGTIYLATSNRDWHPRYQPWMYDSLPEGGDRIIKIEPDFESAIADKNVVIIKENAQALELFSEDWQFDVDDKLVSKGEKLYITHCASCHRIDGAGVKDLFPPLADVDWVTGDKGKLIRTVLFGLSEPIEVNGSTYNQEMPSNINLSDVEIANILTYIRNNFGNEANPIIPGEVYEERKQ